MGAQQKCCAPKSLNCWMPVTNLPTCYASTESWGLSGLNGDRIISFGAPERIHQLHNMFSLIRTSRCTDSRSNHWSGIQVSRARCHVSRCFKSRNRGLMHWNNGEPFTKTSCRSYKRNTEIYILLNLTLWRCFPANFMSQPPQENTRVAKPQHIRHVVYRIENSRFHYQKCLCK